MSQDIFLQKEDACFRLRAAALITKGDRVLMAGNNQADYLYSIGGAVHLGERLEDALLREVQEETGLAMTIQGLAFVHENFFTDSIMGKPKRWHELAFYYHLHCAHPEHIKALGVSMNGQQERLVWVDAASFTSGKVHPSFLPQVLWGDHQNTKHIMSIDDVHIFYER